MCNFFTWCYPQNGFISIKKVRDVYLNCFFIWRIIEKNLFFCYFSSITWVYSLLLRALIKRVSKSWKCAKRIITAWYGLLHIGFTRFWLKKNSYRNMYIRVLHFTRILFVSRAGLSDQDALWGKKIFPKDEIFKKMFAYPAGQKIVKIGQNWLINS